ncbi:MAG: EF-hand domain-containing protein [Sphingomicrobium sp.]
MLVTLAFGAAFISTPVLAQAPGGGGWTQRDQTRAEAQQRADTMFQMLDANKDGTVTRAEAEQAVAKFQAARGGDDQGGRGGGRMQRMIGEAFGTADSLSLQQFEALALARFDASDLNHDGTFTATEREQLRAQRQGQVVPNSQPKAQ